MNIFKKLGKYWNKKFPSIFIAFGLLMMIYGIFLGMVGYHNFDSAQNYMRIDLWLDNEYLSYGINKTWELHETTINDGSKITLVDSYRLGVRQVFKGAILLAFGAMIFASGLTTLEHRAKVIK